jgi:hypothetical protein
MAKTFTYTTQNEEVTISGFMAFLLLQGQDWDYRCMEADIRDYHQQQYARMDLSAALQQEIQWWIDAYHTEHIQNHPEKDKLLSVGICYLFDCTSKLLAPDSDTDKLTTNMSILLNDDNYLYKYDDALALFPKDSEPDPNTLICGFPAQLLTYAACTTIDTMIEQQDIDDPVEWVYMMKNWLQSPSAIHVSHIRFSIPNVYALYASYLEEEKRKWHATCQKYYRPTAPQFRTFMAELRQQCKEEAELAISVLSPYLSDKQRKAYEHYLAECQQYLADHSQSRSKGRSYSLTQYWCPDTADYIQQAAIRHLKDAVRQEHPAAALAMTVKQLQRDGILKKDLRPLTHFIDAVNKICNSDVKYDSFSKHFR